MFTGVAAVCAVEGAVSTGVAAVCAVEGAVSTGVAAVCAVEGAEVGMVEGAVSTGVAAGILACPMLTGSVCSAGAANEQQTGGKPVSRVRCNGTC